MLAIVCELTLGNLCISSYIGPRITMSETDESPVKKGSSSIRKQQQPEARKVVDSVGPHDVLMGRGAPVSEATGNVRLRNLVMGRQPEYISVTKRRDKHKIALEIVQTVRRNGGEFLRKIESTSGGKHDDTHHEDGTIDEKCQWEVVSDMNEITGKVKQLLRDMGPEARQKRANRKRQHYDNEHADTGHSQTTNSEASNVTSESCLSHSGPCVGNNINVRLPQQQQHQQQQASAVSVLGLPSIRPHLTGHPSTVFISRMLADPRVAFLGQSPALHLSTSPNGSISFHGAHVLGFHGGLYQLQQPPQMSMFSGGILEQSLQRQKQQLEQQLLLQVLSRQHDGTRVETPSLPIAAQEMYTPPNTLEHRLSGERENDDDDDKKPAYEKKGNKD